MKLSINGEWFIDDKRRKVLLRGSNICCKNPRFTTASFVGTPFPLEEAKEHFSRLRYWGFNCIRYTVVWEAIEHEGPGVYDTAFLDYLTKIMEEAARHQLFVFIDFHQDVWSRFTGGSGAPAWTLDLAGFRTATLETTGAAIFPKNHAHDHLLWPTNAFKLATATMFTLFFGGSIFAPKLHIQGENIQFFLQRHYVNAMKEVAKRLQHLPNVIGYEILNEPLRGYIEWNDLRCYEGFFSLGFSPTPFQSMVLGMGGAQLIECWEKSMFGPKKVGLQLLNTEGEKAWKTECIWKTHGVWDYTPSGAPKLQIPDYFLYYQSRRVHFTDDFYRPFIRFASQELRSIQPETIIFVENEMFHKPPVWGVRDPTNIVFSTHWYDAYVLALKKFNPFIAVDMFKKSWIIAFPRRIRRFCAKQIQRLTWLVGDRMGKIPTMITEFGIAFDMHQKKAYKTGDFSQQTKALHRSFQAIEDNILSCTIWNYFPGHTKERGDHWNNEDHSIYSSDSEGDKSDPYYGARAKEALIRPYPIHTPGTPESMHFDMKRGIFEFSYKSDLSAGPLEIFLPNLHFGNGVDVTVSDGTYEIDHANQRFYYTHSPATSTHSIKLKRPNTLV